MQSHPRLRPDFLSRQRFFGESRSPERLLAHYLLERELSDQLRRATREVRSLMYTKVYNELFQSLPDHPQQASRQGSGTRKDAELRCISPHLQPQNVLIEVGCGDGALGMAAAKRVRKAYGVDVTDTLIDYNVAPPNFRFLRTSGIDIPLAAEEADFAYSNQLLEHLHPEDAADQLRDVFRVLKPGGRYMCITPSRVTGPHDISAYFDYEARGLHLQEYDYSTLRKLFRTAGFRSFSCFALIRGRQVNLPYTAVRLVERLLLSLPAHIRAWLTRPSMMQKLLGLNFIATK